MRRKYILLLIGLMLIAATVNRLQSQKFSSYEGRHFYVGFMQNEIDILNPNLGIDLKLFITSNYQTRVEVNVPGKSLGIYNVDKDEVRMIDIADAAEVRTSEEPLKKAVEVTSEKPITVYAFSSQSMTSDAYAAIPVAYWGTEYVVVSQPNDVYQINTQLSPEDSARMNKPRSSEFMVMAAHDSTVIRFTPRAVTRKAKQIFREYSVVLNKGECYLVQSLQSSHGTGDLTGTIVRSNKPIGFISGHVRTAVPYDMSDLWDSKDHLAEMLMPASAWGRLFISVPYDYDFLDYYDGDLFRVTGIKDSTVISMSSFSYNRDIILNEPGDFEEIKYINEPVIWHSNKPVQLAQFMAHNGNPAFDSPLFDPSLVIVPPLEQFVQRILFQTPGEDNTRFNEHAVSVIAHKDALSTLQLDGKDLIAISDIQNRKIQGTDYYWDQIILEHGKHELKADSGKFSGILFGLAKRDSYAMVLGSSLNNPFSEDTIPPEVVIVEQCGKIHGLVQEVINENSTGIDFIHVVKDSTFNYEVNIGEITDTSTAVKFYAHPIDIFSDGKLVLEIRDRNGNGKRYEFFYNALNLEIPDRFDFGKVTYNTTKCIDFQIINEGKDSLLISGYDFPSDTRITLTTTPPLSYMMAPADTMDCQLCFDCGTDTTTVNDSLEIFTECDTIRIPVTAYPQNPSLLAKGHDFGEVVVHDTLCDDIVFANDGNAPIWVDSLIIEENSSFDFDTTGIFPYKLYPGDSLVIEVCFTPITRGDLEVTVRTSDNFGIEAEAKVKGKGIAPQFENLVIDWERRRVGTANDSIVFVANTGDASASISLLKFTVPAKDSTSRNFKTLQNLSIYLAKDDSVRLDLLFKPADTSDYNIKAEYSVDWRPHGPFSIELIGKGTIPVLETYDAAFDSTVIFTQKQKTDTVIRSFGNETLHIDSVFVIGGDTEQFNIDLLAYKNINVPYYTSDSLVTMDITYAPDMVGDHELKLGVRNDAMPDYERRVDTITITGICVPADTLDAEVEIEAPSELTACLTTDYKVNIQNTGNVDLYLDDIQIIPDIIEADLKVIPNYPVELPVDSGHSYDIEVFGCRGESGSFIAEAFFSRMDAKPDTIIRSAETLVETISTPLTIDQVEKITATPGDTTSVNLTGDIPHGIDKPVGFSMNLYLDRENFDLLKTQAILFIEGNTNSQKVNVELIQEKARVIIKSESNEIDIQEKSTWGLEIPFMTLLSEEHTPLLKYAMSASDCYLSDSINIEAEITGVCFSGFRNVQLIDNEVLMSVSPNPVRDELTVDLFLPEKGDVKFTINNTLGKKITQIDNLNLEKGAHSLIFDVRSLQNGIYIISMRTKNKIRNSMVIITK